MAMNTEMATAEPILEIESLCVDFGSGAAALRALDGVSLSIRAGERVGLAGQSGCGKSTLVYAIMGYVPPGARVRGGTIRYRGRDILSLGGDALRLFRAEEVAMAPQEPVASLNPALTVGAQLRETPRLQDRPDAEQRIATALERVGLSDAARMLRAYPHELSGGQLQRIAIAMALLEEPRLLLLDEPTTALDSATEAEIVSLLAQVCADREMTVIHVSHDRNLLAETCDRVIVMRDGRIVPDAGAKKFPDSSVPPVRGGITGSSDIVVRVDGLSKTYSERDRWNRVTGQVVALSGVGFTLRRGETLAIVGESGSGKSTIGRVVAGLDTATAGRVMLDNTDVAGLAVSRRPAGLRRAVQMVFQDPDGALNPRLSVGRQIGRAVRAGGYTVTKAAREAEVRRLLESVRLDPQVASRSPRALSGGQKQRVAIACAFAVRPRLIVADEPVSALDAGSRGAVLDLLAELQDEHGTALLLISHDLDVVRSQADQVIVLYRGQIMEQGRAEVVFEPPSHPYTAMLLAASRRGGVPVGSGRRLGEAGRGCAFAGRCPKSIAGTCDTLTPPERVPGWEHRIYCHLAMEDLPYGDGS